MTRYPYGFQDFVKKILAARDQRLHQLRPPQGVRPERGTGLLQRAVQHCRRTVVEGMGHGSWGTDPLEPELLQRKSTKEWGDQRHRVDGGTQIVNDTRRCDFRATTAAADRIVCLEHGHRCSRSGKNDRGRKAIRTAADNDSVEGGQHPAGSKDPAYFCLSHQNGGRLRPFSPTSFSVFASIRRPLSITMPIDSELRMFSSGLRSRTTRSASFPFS